MMKAMMEQHHGHMNMIISVICVKTGGQGKEETHSKRKITSVLSESKKKLAGEMHFGLQNNWLADMSVWQVVGARLK